jgi:hypothetical protein
MPVSESFKKWDWRAYLPGLSLLTVLMFMLLIIEATLIHIGDSHGRGVVPVQKQVKDISAKLVAAARLEEPSALIVGTSSAMDGFSVRRLSEATPYRWVNLGIECHSFQQLETSLSPLLHGDKRYPVIVFAVHAMLLAQNDAAPPLKRQNQIARSFLLKVALELQQQFYSADWEYVDPYAEEIRSVKPRDESAAELMLEKFHDFGRERVENYALDNAESRALRNMLSELDQKSERLIVVVMPEGRNIRNLVPEKGEEILRTILSSKTNNARVLNRRDAIPDSGFFDDSHLTTPGRTLLTEQLVQQLESKNR